MYENVAMLDLHLFDDAGGAAGADAGSSAVGTADGNSAAASERGRQQKNPLAGVVYGKQVQTETQSGDTATPGEQGERPETAATGDTLEARRAEFEKLINSDYCDLYDERVQRIVKDRVKDHAELQKTVAGLEPVVEMLAQKYGVDGKDIGALAKAIQEDDTFYEEEAYEKGVSVEQLKHMKAVERENAEFKRAAEDIQRRQASEQLYQRWQQQGDALKEMYPSFDFRTEVNDMETGGRFISLLKSGVDVRTAYEVIHHDSILGGAMQYAVNTTREKTLNDVRARGTRPAENGTSGTSAAVVKTDPSKLTRKDREEIARRVARGDTSITF